MSDSLNHSMVNRRGSGMLDLPEPDNSSPISASSAVETFSWKITKRTHVANPNADHRNPKEIRSPKPQHVRTTWESRFTTILRNEPILTFVPFVSFCSNSEFAKRSQRVRENHAVSDFGLEVFKNYETNPCARRASSRFRVQGSMFQKMRNEPIRPLVPFASSGETVLKVIFTKRTHFIP